MSSSPSHAFWSKQHTSLYLNCTQIINENVSTLRWRSCAGIWLLHLKKIIFYLHTLIRFNCVTCTHCYYSVRIHFQPFLHLIPKAQETKLLHVCETLAGELVQYKNNEHAAYCQGITQCFNGRTLILISVSLLTILDLY